MCGLKCGKTHQKIDHFLIIFFTDVSHPLPPQESFSFWVVKFQKAALRFFEKKNQNKFKQVPKKILGGVGGCGRQYVILNENCSKFVCLETSTHYAAHRRELRYTAVKIGFPLPFLVPQSAGFGEF